VTIFTQYSPQRAHTYSNLPCCRGNGMRNLAQKFLARYNGSVDGPRSEPGDASLDLVQVLQLRSHLPPLSPLFRQSRALRIKPQHTRCSRPTGVRRAFLWTFIRGGPLKMDWFRNPSFSVPLRMKTPKLLHPGQTTKPEQWPIIDPRPSTRIAIFVRLRRRRPRSRPSRLSAAPLLHSRRGQGRGSRRNRHRRG